MAKKHTTDARAARIAGRFGWKLEDKEANDKAREPAPFRLVDSGNLSRLATAAERISNYLGRLVKVAEDRERRDLERYYQEERDRKAKMNSELSV